MAGVKFSRKEFEKHVKLTKEIEEKISMMGTHLESITDEEIELEINPNRPDLLSLHGFLRAFLAFLGRKTGLKTYKLNKPIKNYEVIVDSSLKNIRPYTACCIIKNVSFNSEKIKEIIDIQEKIHLTLGRNRKKIAIGIYPLEKISLPIKFEAKKPENIRFIPLEMNKELNGRQIIQQHPTGREYAHLLEGMDKFPVFTDSKGKVLSMPPIINSNETGKITEKTKDIFIECSGSDFNSLKKTLNILATMFADMGGEIYQMKLKGINETTPDLSPLKMKINKENINKLLGLNLKESEIKRLIERMGYDYKSNNVFIPAWRTDIMHEVDIIEDIAIAYGYNNFTPEIPEIANIGEISKNNVIKNKISEILSGLSMLETSSYHLFTKEDIKKAGTKDAMEVEKSKTDYKLLRNSLLLSSLKILGENVDSDYPQKIFEIGKVFEKSEKEETGIEEKEKLAIALTPGNFTEIKQILEYLGRMLSIKFSIEEETNKNFIEGRTGKIILNEKNIGVIGEISPATLKTWHIKMPLACLELDLTEIFGLLS
ncbi:phenylalanine--tRNA ligase subunit beta [Candidatus Pacearchaeota archaeon]|nr:phenylalanine--tRNA ligase subunit beta [Candidatus Pacearchaeota archaeon]